MSQTTLDDDLFDEAAAEVRADVESHLEAAREALPAVDDIWAVETENVLGVLNGLKGALDLAEAREELRDAKKWYTMGERADAFEDAEDLADEIEALEALVEQFDDAEAAVGELTTTLPELRSALADAREDEPDED
jgi:hypothetical protein